MTKKAIKRPFRNVICQLSKNNNNKNKGKGKKFLNQIGIPQCYFLFVSNSTTAVPGFWTIKTKNQLCQKWSTFIISSILNSKTLVLNKNALHDPQSWYKCLKMVKIFCVHISIKFERWLLFEQKFPNFSFSSIEAGNKVWMWITDHALNNSALVVQTEEHSDGFWINPEELPHFKRLPSGIMSYWFHSFRFKQLSYCGQVGWLCLWNTSVFH